MASTEIPQVIKVIDENIPYVNLHRITLLIQKLLTWIAKRYIEQMDTCSKSVNNFELFTKQKNENQMTL